MSNDDKSLLRLVDPSDSEYLNEEEQVKIVSMLYKGHTPLEICVAMDIGREKIDISVRHDANFREAMRMAVSAMGDVLAERSMLGVAAAGEKYFTAPDGSRVQIPLQEREFNLKYAKLNADMHRWLAERTSNLYKPKTPEKTEKQKPKKLHTSVPPREPTGK